MAPKFSEITVPAHTEDSIARDYAALNAALDRGDRAKALKDWDRKAREYATWASLAWLRSDRDLNDQSAKAANIQARDLSIKKQEHSLALTQRLLADPDRKGLETLVGSHAVRLWEIGVTTFDPIIAGDLKEERKLTTRYRELIAGGTAVLDGRTMRLTALEPFAQSLDRDMRHRAEAARWGFYEANGEELDEIFDGLVKVRNGMFGKLGFESYTALAYQLNGRMGYGVSEVAQFREEVARLVVPLVGRILDRRQAEAGWDHTYSWDAGLADLKGNPKPAGDHDVLINAARTMFGNMDPRLSAFYDEMVDGGFMDLKNRPGKATSSYCESFPSIGMPFIFGNFDSTYRDPNLLIHELGHGFQHWMSRDQPVIEYLQASNEAGEIPSKGLEYLSYPFIDPMLEKGAADRYRRVHLTNGISSLPGVLLVDHFQHEVYANPSASPADRNEMWRTLEKRYMPRLDFGDMDYPAKGTRWQTQRHIFNSPFYYIDYAMAECSALQLWAKSRVDYTGAMDTYVDLCKRGGEAPFQDLVRGAGLTSPLDPGAMASVIRDAETELGLGGGHVPVLKMALSRRPGLSSPSG